MPKPTVIFLLTLRCFAQWILLLLGSIFKLGNGNPLGLPSWSTNFCLELQYEFLLVVGQILFGSNPRFCSLKMSNVLFNARNWLYVEIPWKSRPCWLNLPFGFRNGPFWWLKTHHFCTHCNAISRPPKFALDRYGSCWPDLLSAHNLSHAPQRGKGPPG